MSARDAGEAARVPVGLAAYGLPYLCGFAGSGTPRACPRPYDAYRLMDLAALHGLSGVEFPPAAMLGSQDPAALARVRAAAQEAGLSIVVDSGVVEGDALRALLPVASALGARIIRATVSTILCGERQAMAGDWPRYLHGIADGLRAVRAQAEDLGVCIALENHQDLTSVELADLCAELDSPSIGITLDTGNPLAVAEDPLAAAARMAPYIKHVHLKDYRVFSTAHGFRLARCALGAGVVDFPAILALLAREAPTATLSIELGALQARHIRFLDDAFWPAYPSRPITDLLPVLRMREARGHPRDGDPRTPWERGVGGEALAAYELSELEESVVYLRRIIR